MTMTAEAAPADSAPTQWVKIGTIEGDGPIAASAGGVDVVVVRGKTGLRVLEGRCPHQGALLGEGELIDGQLVCRNHRWRFDPQSGRRDGGAQCLRVCPSELRGGELWADVAELAERREKAAPRRTWKSLPGPRGVPLLGNALQIDPKRLHLVLEGWAREYGSTYRVRFGRKKMIVTTEPALINEALRARPETYRRDSRVEPIFRELGVDGVFSAEGAAWRPQRRLAMEALSQKNLRGFYPTLARVAERLRVRWQKAAAAGGAVDILDDLMRFTVDVTTTLVFGHDLDTVSGGADVIQQHLQEFFPAFNRRLSSVVPWWRIVRSAADRRTDRALAALRAWLHDLVVAARARLAEDPARAERPANFLEAMLAMRDDQGKPFGDEVIFGNAMTMLLAGEDTTAYTLAWAVHHMCDAPGEVAALRAELDAVLGGAAVPPDLERANQLEHATAIAQESMRLRPVAPSQFLEAIGDEVLGDVEVPRGASVVVLQRVAAVDDAHFADGASFKPSRWIAPVGAHDTSTFVPFGSGPRICPGRSLALLEMRVVLATLYGSFDVTRAGDAAAVQEKFAFTMAPTGLAVSIAERAR